MAAASKLVRNILKVVVILLAAKFGVHPQMMQEGLARWWSHRLVVNPAGDGQVVGGRWPLGVSVPLSLLPATQRTRGAENGVSGGLGRRVVFLSSIPNSDRCTQEQAVASLILLWGKESRVRRPIRTALFRAQLAQQNKKNRAAAASRRATDAVAESAAAVRPGVAAASAAAAARQGTHGAHHHVVIAPRPGAVASRGGASAATSAATNDAVAQGALTGSSVVAARAATRAAARRARYSACVPRRMLPRRRANAAGRKRLEAARPSGDGMLPHGRGSWRRVLRCQLSLLSQLLLRPRRWFPPQPTLGNSSLQLEPFREWMTGLMICWTRQACKSGTVWCIHRARYCTAVLCRTTWWSYCWRVFSTPATSTRTK